MRCISSRQHIGRFHANILRLLLISELFVLCMCRRWRTLFLSKTKKSQTWILSSKIRNFYQGNFIHLCLSFWCNDIWWVVFDQCVIASLFSLLLRSEDVEGDAVSMLVLNTHRAGLKATLTNFLRAWYILCWNVYISTGLSVLVHGRLTFSLSSFFF